MPSSDKKLKIKDKTPKQILVRINVKSSESFVDSLDKITPPDNNSSYKDIIFMGIFQEVFSFRKNMHI